MAQKIPGREYPPKELADKMWAKYQQIKKLYPTKLPQGAAQFTYKGNVFSVKAKPSARAGYQVKSADVDRLAENTRGGQRLTLLDYVNHPRYKDDASLAQAMFEYDQKMLKRQGRFASRENQLDHIDPKKGDKRAGIEHWRNKMLAGAADNIRKSNKQPSDEALEYLGIGRTPEEMIDRAASSPWPRQTPRDKRTLLQGDLGIEYTKGMGLSASRGGLKFASNLGRADQAAQIGVNLATGNVAGAAVGGGIMAATEAAKSKVGQKAIAEILAKRAGKSAAKFVPGVDVAISAAEVADYASKGRFDQAGIAALSGLVGWVPGIGDAAAAGLDAVNTGLDIARLDTPGKPDVEAQRGGLRYKPRL